MSYTRHIAILVTAYNVTRLEAAHAKALSLFQSTAPDFSVEMLARAASEGVNLHQRAVYMAPCGLATVSPILQETCNYVTTFMIAPDGSKAGWAHAEAAEIARKVFISWMHDQRVPGELSSYLSWAEVSYDDPDGDNLRQSSQTGIAHSDLDRLLSREDDRFLLDLKGHLDSQPIPDTDQNIRFVSLGLMHVDYSARLRTCRLTPAGLAYRGFLETRD